ncbi:DgyrCDS9012 [Dimorphilus gyrociliatus]|uniref:DgyrCDS9012 n=1 Tax=Dimorphilus gyrociliatus TaxID=2664684 RepID=A0A7I8VW66_9ANNE|nr:DgyrCDS9012 [Dimorphilus gyrociliatus]
MAYSSIVRNTFHKIRLSTSLGKNLGTRSLAEVPLRHSSSNATEQNESIIAIQEMHRFMKDCMLAVGCTETDSNQLAETLVHADHRGHYSHGLNRLDMYVEDVRCGATVSGIVEPIIIKETTSSASVDGNNLLGPVVGNFCMQLAIKKARESGISLVVAKGSNHYGIAGHYSLQAVREGMIGISMTNTSPLVVPTRASECILGTNPIAVGAPGLGDDCFVLDMATSAAALGKLELADRKSQKIPIGWGADSTGQATEDPKEALKGGLMPLGGIEYTSGYKGFGLAMLVEVLTGILSGGAYGPFVRKWKVRSKLADLGQMFMVINPNFFPDGFRERMQELMDFLRQANTAPDAKGNVLVAGDPERQNIAKCERIGGIPYSQVQVDYANNLAKLLQIDQPKIL